MPTALLCTQADLSADLGHTLLWRHGIERLVAPRLEDARMMAVAARPEVVLVDRDLPRAEKLVAELRADASTRGLSIVVMARGDFEPTEVELLEAGANAILRIPAGREWDERLERLIHVPVRKEARFPVQLAVDAVAAGQAVPAMALNLSVNGMLMETHETVAVGDELRLAFCLPESEDPIRAEARVVRQTGSGRFGVEFQGVEADGRERIRAFVGGLEAS